MCLAHAHIIKELTIKQSNYIASIFNVNEMGAPYPAFTIMILLEPF